MTSATTSVATSATTVNCGELMVPGGTPLRTASESLYNFLGGKEETGPFRVTFLQGRNKLTVYILNSTFKTETVPKQWHGIPVFVRRAFRSKDM